MLTELVELPGGSFRMGSTRFYPEEAPVHTATVGAYAVERHPVTNAQFAEFVADTGYVTVAEQAPDPALYPGAVAEDLVPGALVFRPTGGPVDLRLAAVVGVGAWRELAPPVRPAKHNRGPARPPSDTGRISRRGGLRP